MQEAPAPESGLLKRIFAPQSHFGLFLGGMGVTAIAQPILMRYGVNVSLPMAALNTCLLAAQGVAAKMASADKNASPLFSRAAHAYGALSFLSGGSQMLGVGAMPVKEGVKTAALSVMQAGAAGALWLKSSRFIGALGKVKSAVYASVPLVTAGGTLGLLAQQTSQAMQHHAPGLAMVGAGAATALGCLMQARSYHLAHKATGHLFARNMDWALRTIAAANVVTPVAMALLNK